MPGPRSEPWAMVNGVKVVGKTALKHAKARSGQGSYRPEQPKRAGKDAKANLA